MALLTSVCSVLLAAVLTSSLSTEQAQTEGRWSKQLSSRQEVSSSSDWVPMTVPCPSCQPNDRISANSDQAEVGSLLTPPLPDYQQVPSFLPPKQFREKQRPVAQQLVRQQNGHQQFLPQTQEEVPPKFQHLPEQQRGNVPKPEILKQFATPPTAPQFLPNQNGGIQLIPENSHTGPGGPTHFIQQPLQQEFAVQQSGFPLLFPQENPNGQVPFNADPNQGRNNQYQQLVGPFFQQQQPPVNFDQQFVNESDVSGEEKPDVQLVYVPVETLKQRGRFHIPRKPTSQTITELKSDSQLQVEPSALAAEETRQQRQSFQQYVEQQPSVQTATQRPHPTRLPHHVPSSQPHSKSQQDEQQILQSAQQLLQAQRVGQEQQGQQDQQSLRQQLLQALRALPTDIPQEQVSVTEQFFNEPHHTVHSTRIPHLQQQQSQQHQIQQQFLTNEGHYLQALRPHPTNNPQFQQQSHQRPEQFQQNQLPHPTQITQFQFQQAQQPQTNDDQFLQYLRPISTVLPQVHTQVPDEPQPTVHEISQTQRTTPSRAPQSQRSGATQSSTQPPILQTQQPLQATRRPQGVEEDDDPQYQERLTSSTTPKPKPVPHQPPLSVYMGKEGHDIKITDVIKVLKNAKSIAVLDAVGPESPQVFVGPSNLKPPLSYAKFELPYLSSIESNRVERKVDEFPFFVAPLNFKPPPGYSKIPFPAPHIGSVVVSNGPKERAQQPPQEEIESPTTAKPSRGRFSSQYNLPAELPAINPQLPTLVNSLQDSRHQGNAFLVPARQNTNVPQAQLRRPHQRVPVQQVQQVKEVQQVQQEEVQQFQEPELISEVPPTVQFSPTHRVPQSNQFSDFPHVTTTPQPHLFSTTRQPPRFQQPPQFHQPPQFQEPPLFQQPPLFQAPSRVPPTSQYSPTQTEPEVQDNTPFPQFQQNHFSSQDPQKPQLEQTQYVTQAPEVTTYPQFTENNHLSHIPQTSQFLQEVGQVSQSPEIQQYIQHQESLQAQTTAPIPQEETIVQEPEVPSTPAPRIPKRGPSYRTRQRTTEAPTSEDVTTTTRKPYTRGRRPTYTRQRAQQQVSESQQSTTSPHQYQAELEPSSTTEYVTGLKYSTRTPVRSQSDRLHSSRVTAQEETTTKRNYIPRSRGRTRERNSQKVTGQSLPNYTRQTVEQEPVTPQVDQEYVVPPHESKRQQQAFNHNYNTERSGFEEPTTEQNRVDPLDNQFEENQSNLQQRVTPHVENVQQQHVLQFQSVQPVSSTGQPLVAFQNGDSYFQGPRPTASPQDSIPFQEVNIPVTSTTVHPEIQSFAPQYESPNGPAVHRTRVQGQLVNEQQTGLPQFTLPVQVSVSGRTERPEVEETPRPVYVRIRGQTRGRRPQSQANDGGHRALPQHQQHRESSERLQKTVPQYTQQEQDQEPFYQNQQRRPQNGGAQNLQPSVNRQRTPQVTEGVGRQETKPAAEAAEEEYGFIRPVSFPPTTVQRETTSTRPQEPSPYEEDRISQESLENLDGTVETTPSNKVRQNFLVRTSNRRPAKSGVEASTTPAAIYTVRPSRRPQAVKQQVRITSVRGRMRRPTTSTTELPGQFSAEPQSPSTTEVQFVKRRPTNRYNPSEATNEVAGESQDAYNTPRSSLQRYESQTRGTATYRRPGGQQDDVGSERSSTPSAFQITLLDDPPNYPAHFTAKLQAQNQLNYHQRPDDQTSLNSDNLPRFLPDDPEGGAESQWATKRLPYAYTGKEGTTPLISFTTEFPRIEQTVTEVPEEASSENVTGKTESVNGEYPEHKVPSSPADIVHATTEYPTHMLPNAPETDDGKTQSKEDKELDSAQKKASDYNANKKPSSRRRGSWVRRRKVPRPQDLFETAESIHIDAVSKNQIKHMASKGIHINSWPLPSPSLVTDQTVFDVPKISPEDSYVTVDENAGEVLVPSIVEDGSSRIKEITGYPGKKEVVEIITTTAEPSIVVTEQSKSDEVTALYITPNPEEVNINNKKEIQEDTISITTDSPFIETTTQQHFEVKQVDEKPLNVNQSNEGSVAQQNPEENKQTVQETPEPTPEEIKPQVYEETLEKTHVEEKVQFKDTPEITSKTKVTVDTHIHDEAQEKVNGETVKVSHEVTTDKPKEKAKDEKPGIKSTEEVKDQLHGESVPTSDKVQEKETDPVIETTSVKTDTQKEKDQANKEHLSIQSSVQDAIQQNTPTEGTTYSPGVIQEIDDATTTEIAPEELESPDEIIRTSMRTEISHETEICYRGRCVKTKTADNDHLAE